MINIFFIEFVPKILFMFSCQSWMIKYFLEELCICIGIIMNLKKSSRKSESTLIRTTSIINRLECFSFIDVCKNITIIICDLINISFCKSRCFFFISHFYILNILLYNYNLYVQLLIYTLYIIISNLILYFIL